MNPRASGCLFARPFANGDEEDEPHLISIHATYSHRCSMGLSIPPITRESPNLRGKGTPGTLLDRQGAPVLATSWIGYPVGIDGAVRKHPSVWDMFTSATAKCASRRVSRHAMTGCVEGGPWCSSCVGRQT
jgi:hypothetical protein